MEELPPFSRQEHLGIFLFFRISLTRILMMFRPDRWLVVLKSQNHSRLTSPENEKWKFSTIASDCAGIFWSALLGS